MFKHLADPFPKTSLDGKVKDVNIEEIINHKIKDVEGFESLLIYKIYNELITSLNEMQYKDLLLLKNNGVFGLLFLNLDELYKTIVNKNKNFNVFHYDSLCNKLLYLKGLCSLKIKTYLETATNQRVLTYYKDVEIKDHWIGRTNSRMGNNDEFKLDLKESSENYFVHLMVRRYISKYYESDYGQFLKNTAQDKDYGDIRKEKTPQRPKTRNPFKPKHKPTPKGLRFINPTSKKK